MVVLAVAALWLIWVNRQAYDAFRWDKDQAFAGGQRVPERVLLMLAAYGGWFGAKVAQRRFRHKTRKEPFRSRLNRIGLVQGVVLLALAFPPVGQGAWKMVQAVEIAAVWAGGIALAKGGDLVAEVMASLDAPAAAGTARARGEAPSLPGRFGPGS